MRECSALIVHREVSGPGFVLYNGDRPFDVRGTRVRNPLHVGHLWQTLTTPSPQAPLPGGEGMQGSPSRPLAGPNNEEGRDG